MKSDAGGQDVIAGFCHADTDGYPDFSRPMTRDEVVEMYWASQEDSPSSASDLYLDFHTFDQIEFLVFADRLSSAVLLYRGARAQLEDMRTKLMHVKQTGSHRIPGWVGECDLVMDEELAVVEGTYAIAAGAATVTAAAALESLLIDLVPKGQEPPSGLHNLLSGFLAEHGSQLARSQRKSVIGKGLEIGKRRNQFAHALTGSYFDQSPTGAGMFTEEAVEETFRLVGSLAIAIEELLHRRVSAQRFDWISNPFRSEKATDER